MAVYFPDGRFMGYTINRANGINYNTHDDRLTLRQSADLHMYARDHDKIEKKIQILFFLIFVLVIIYFLMKKEMSNLLIMMVCKLGDIALFAFLLV